MSEDMLRDIETLRGKANVSYEEAATLLEQNGGDVIRALMALEAQGRLYQQSGQGHAEAKPEEPWRGEAQEAGKKVKSFLHNAFEHRLVIEKKGEDEQNKTVLNVSLPLAVGAAVVAPYLAVASAAAAVVSGCRVKMEKDEHKGEKEPE